MPSYDEKGFGILPPRLPDDRQALARLRKANNPDDEPVGHFTGRYKHCGSNDLWDDNGSYGCNSCHALLCVSG